MILNPTLFTNDQYITYYLVLKLNNKLYPTHLIHLAYLLFP